MMHTKAIIQHMHDKSSRPLCGQYLTEANQTSSFASSLFKQNQIANSL